jgi:hypothetical protein
MLTNSVGDQMVGIGRHVSWRSGVQIRKLRGSKHDHMYRCMCADSETKSTRVPYWNASGDQRSMGKRSRSSLRSVVRAAVVVEEGGDERGVMPAGCTCACEKLVH